MKAGSAIGKLFSESTKKMVREWRFTNYLRFLHHFGLKGIAAYHKISSAENGLIKISIPQCRTPIALRAGTTDIDVFMEVFFYEQYLAAVPHQPALIIDAGAHIGLTSLFFANKFPDAKIFAIEPAPTNIEMLELNTVDYPNIALVRAGLWGEHRLLRISNPDSTNWGFRVEPAGSGIEALPAVTVEDILKLAGTDTIDILKMDIEGSEREVFAASQAWIGKVRTLIVELHDRWAPGCTAALDLAVKPYKFNRRRDGVMLTLVRV